MEVKGEREAGEETEPSRQKLFTVQEKLLRVNI